MWKKVGSVKSGDNKSVHSNTSSQERHFQSFHHNIVSRVNLSQQVDDHKRTNYEEYIKHKRQREANSFSYHSRAKSQKNLNTNNNENDLFTNMRNMTKYLNEGAESHKDSLVEMQTQMSKISNKKNSKKLSKEKSIIRKQAQYKLKNLRKDQIKLKSLLQNQIKSFGKIMKEFSTQLQKIRPIKNQSNIKKSSEGFISQIIDQTKQLLSVFRAQDAKKNLLLRQYNLSTSV